VACHAALLQVIEDFAAEHTTYLELRTTPKVGAALASRDSMAGHSRQPAVVQHLTVHWQVVFYGFVMQS
jgi:hypothetical protein